MTAIRTITFLPALLPLEKNSKKQLIERIRELEDVIGQLNKLQEASSGKLSEMCLCAHDLGAQLYALVDAYDCNDQAAIAVQLNAMSDRRKSYKKPEVH